MSIHHQHAVININQLGVGNISVLEQNGFSNQAILNVIGADNKTSLVQNGEGNRAKILLIGSGVSQTGNGLRL